MVAVDFVPSSKQRRPPAHDRRQPYDEAGRGTPSSMSCDRHIANRYLRHDSGIKGRDMVMRRFGMWRRDWRGLLPRVGAIGVLGVGLGQPIGAHALTFTPGDLVVSVEGNGDGSASTGTAATGNTGASANTYLDNQAAPLTLYEYTTAPAQANPVGALVLPQTPSGSNMPVSGEYGSSSEAQLQLSGDGHYLTIAGYATNAQNYNSHYDQNGGSLNTPATGTALAQSCSLSSNCGTTPQVARVIATVSGSGQVNSSTTLYNVANENNPRSVYSANGQSFYISGQGSGNAGDLTGGVFYVPGVGPGQTAVPITGTDATSTGNPPNNIGQDTRFVTAYNNTLYVSTDTKEGSGSARDFIGTLGSPPATSLYNGGSGPTQLSGFGTSKTGIMAITTGANSNGNPLNAGQSINLSPADFFFANATTLYVADTGAPKNDKAGDTSTKTTNIGDGGLQKWTLSNGTWTLDYTLTAGLIGFVQNNAASGTTGLLGLTGVVDGSTVELFATNYTIGDTDQTYLYGIDDTLSDTMASQASGEAFSVLATAPEDTNFKGVAFAPTATPLPASWTLMLCGLAVGGLLVRARQSKAAAAA
jgi:hypothetical protein